MNNCSCIFARQREDEKVVFFESKHTLPFFWLMLIDKEDIESYRDKMAQTLEVDTEQKDNYIVLDKLNALLRAANRRDYVKKHLITCLSLFDDWLYYLQISDFSDMKIYIDLYPLRSSYNNVNEFCDSISKGVICLDKDIEAWDEDTIATTCGYEGQNNNKKPFSHLSEAYRELNKKNIYGHFDKKIYLDKKLSFRKKRWILAAILLIITALIIAFVYIL